MKKIIGIGIKGIIALFQYILKIIKFMLEEKIIVHGKVYSAKDSRIFKDPFDGKWYSKEIDNIYSYPRTFVVAGVGLSSISINEIRDFCHWDNNIKTAALFSGDKVHTVCINGEHFHYRKDCITKEELGAMGFVPGNLNSNIFFHHTQLKKYDMPKPYRKFDNTVSEGKLFAQQDAGLITATQRLKAEIKAGIRSQTFMEFENLKYPFGIEIETATGTITEEEAEGLNFKAVHDGSLRGPNGEDPLGGEYVTGVLRGDAGLAQLYEQCRILKQKCTIDNRCGVHVHIGDFANSKENIVYSYLLGLKIETSIKSILPKSRRNHSYCRDLDVLIQKSELIEFSKSTGVEYEHYIDLFYERIFGYTSFDGKTHHKPCKELNHSCNHPKGSKCQYIKSTQRYCWLNLVTFVFNTRGNSVYTLEFRNHGASMNYNKIKAWTKVCMAFVAYVDSQKHRIKADPCSKMSVEELVSVIYKKTGAALINYIQERRSVFMTKTEIVDHEDNEIFNKKSIKEIICV